MTRYRITHNGRLTRPTRYNLPRMRKIRFGKVTLLPKRMVTISEEDFRKDEQFLRRLAEVGMITIVELNDGIEVTPASKREVPPTVKEVPSQPVPSEDKVIESVVKSTPEDNVEPEEKFGDDEKVEKKKKTKKSKRSKK